MTVLTEPAAIEPTKPQITEFQAVDTADKMISESKIEKICFVCTGNTCRSPMAMALYNHLYKHKNSYAVSLGLYPCIGEPISQNAIQALNESGIEAVNNNRFDKHTANEVTEEKLSSCNLIIGMTQAHSFELICRFPRIASRIITMPEPVCDPFGGDINTYKACLVQIEKGLKELFSNENNL
ncbi:MAG: hypothetical protein IKU52_03335 [Clostridia bacterium]|nr:hypothetical protein [Clostridia bacterium]